MPIAADPTPLGPHLTNTVDKTGKIVATDMVLNPIFSGQAIHQKNVETDSAPHIEGEQIPALTHMLNQDVPVLKEDAVTTDESTPEVEEVPHSSIEEKKVAATEATAKVTADKPVTDGENDAVEKVEGEYEQEEKPLEVVSDESVAAVHEDPVSPGEAAATEETTAPEASSDQEAATDPAQETREITPPLNHTATPFEPSTPAVQTPAAEEQKAAVAALEKSFKSTLLNN